MKTNELCLKLDLMINNPKCELIYNNGYELVIAVMLSSQCTDKRVNIVTRRFFSKYTMKEIANLDLKIIEKEIKSLGSYTRKAYYIKEITNRLLNDYNGVIPNDRTYLESLPGIGRKCANVILSELFNVPTIAVDTHVQRVSKRLELVKQEDNIKVIENKLMRIFPEDDYNKINHQLILFGRYICTSKNPKCCECLIKCKNKRC